MQEAMAASEKFEMRFSETEWEAKESQRQRELEEARARAVQMEKTMKWWSDCTANWREKWSKVRNERNKAREEVKQLRVNLDLGMKEVNSYKREKNDLEVQITQLKKEMEKVHVLMMQHAGQFDKAGSSGDNDDGGNIKGQGTNRSPDLPTHAIKNINSEDGLVTKVISADMKDLDIEEYMLKGAVPKNLNIDDVAAEEKRLIQQLSKNDFDEDSLFQKISMLQLRLDEALKTVQAERDEKHGLHKNMEKLTLEIQELRDRQEEIRVAKQEAVRELLTLQEQHRAEMRIVNNMLQEEIASRENLERRLGELRIELERMQAENASEWGKRERLETEKLALERDIKKLRVEIRELQERSDRKGRPIQPNDVEFRALQQELSDKNKESSEMKLTQAKLKKLLAETNTELGHAVRRAEQYEEEVKRLRQRIEELKRELAGAEDELDSAINQVRRLQRSNDELVRQSEGLHVQIQHLQKRRVPSPQLRGSCSVQLRNKIAVELPSDCLPNIHDLRQIFDDSQAVPRHVNPNGDSISRRSNHPECTLLQQNTAFVDAKPSLLEENVFESKSRNLEFERAKQKFDNPLNGHHHHQREQRERPSGRFVASGKRHSNDQANLALPLKGFTTAYLGANPKINLSHTTHSKDDRSRQLGHDNLHFSSGGGIGDGSGGNIGKSNGVNYFQTTKITNNGSSSCNSINLDGLEVSGDEKTS